MFIKLLAKLNRGDAEPTFVWFDAHRIVRISEHPLDRPGEEGCMFWFHDADVGGALPYQALSYDAESLVELVMQARLRPAECLPSLYVGKRAAPDDNPNNVAWSAKDGEKSST